MSAPTVLLSGPVMPFLAESLRASYDVVELPQDGAARASVLAEHGPRARAAVVAVGKPFDAATIAACPQLRVISSFGVGYDTIDVAAARERGIGVSHTPDVLNEAVAELAVGLSIDVLRRVPAADRYVRAGRWELDGPFPLTRQLSGRRVGILGLGRIGRAIAERFTPFGCPVGYHSRRQVEGAPYDYFDSPVALAEWAQVLVVVVPGTPQTAGMVDRAVLEALGEDGVLVNVARGSVVDQEVLVELLLDGRLGGAGLDVFAAEPQVPEELLALDSVVLQPHLGSGTVETRTAMARLVLDNVERGLRGEPLATPVP
jgi:lactate dehydrogenase-like 2-hydroxyacid dehydrogenase